MNEGEGERRKGRTQKTERARERETGVESQGERIVQE